jgi:hypothetical protein
VPHSSAQAWGKAPSGYRSVGSTVEEQYRGRAVPWKSSTVEEQYRGRAALKRRVETLIDLGFSPCGRYANPPAHRPDP